jgi:hypothetical protein
MVYCGLLDEVDQVKEGFLNVFVWHVRSIEHFKVNDFELLIGEFIIIGKIGIF